MKYIVVLGDGMADEPIESLGGKTPLEYAKTPVMDTLAEKSEIGLLNTIPEGMSPGSDVANLSVLGYNPREFYSGRSPLEALSIGVDMKTDDIALRCNIVTLSEDEEDYSKKKILDHSAGEISTEDASVLLDAVKAAAEDEIHKFYAGTSYRHLLIVNSTKRNAAAREQLDIPAWDMEVARKLTPPHDVLGQVIAPYLPLDEVLLRIQEKSYEILSSHPINIQRKKEGKNPANSCWFWGAGTRPDLVSFYKKYGKKGAMVSAVDLLKGIAVGAEMHNIDVEGANGGLHTNYEGKAKAAVDALLNDGYDFVYIHVEAPDEMGHQGNVNNKVKAIEFLDGRIIKQVMEKMDKSGLDYRMLILPDHPTPIRYRTHTSDPIPYLLYDSTMKQRQSWHYNEKEAKTGKNYIDTGHKMMDYLFAR